MSRRFGSVIAVLALLAVAVLVFRPVALQALGSPYGSHFSPDVELTKAEGSPHCALLADCETISISNVGLNLGQAGIVLALGGLVVLTARPGSLRARSWTALVPVKPPLSHA